MRRVSLILLLPGALLLQCAPAVVNAGAEGVTSLAMKSSVPVFSDRAQFEAHFRAALDSACSPIELRLAGKLQKQWRHIISDQVWGEYARRCTIRYAESGEMTLTLEYRDYMRMRKALRIPSSRASLNNEESRVLADMEKRVKSLLRPGMSDYEKLCALHDFLVQHARYDASGGGNVADVLYHGRGSCEAYSAAMNIMMELAGMKSRVVTGLADGGPHAWNLVSIDGSWYHVDATWDDPVIDGGRKQVLSHAYLCRTDAEMSATHSWNRLNYPRSGGGTSYYYKQRGAYFTSFDSFWKAAMLAYQRGASSYEGFLTTYGSAEQFQRNLQRVSSPSSPRQVRWTGPDTAAGTVIVNFAS